MPFPVEGLPGPAQGADLSSVCTDVALGGGGNGGGLPGENVGGGGAPGSATLFADKDGARKERKETRDAEDSAGDGQRKRPVGTKAAKSAKRKRRREEERDDAVGEGAKKLFTISSSIQNMRTDNMTEATRRAERRAARSTSADQ